VKPASSNCLLAGNDLPAPEIIFNPPAIRITVTISNSVSIIFPNGREWYTPLVGLMPEDSSSRRWQRNPRDPIATPIVAQMDELFAVDAEARRKTLTTAARHIRRQETARPLLDDIRSKIEAAQSVALPSSALSKACQ
jgi:Transposase IS66 family